MFDVLSKIHLTIYNRQPTIVNELMADTANLAVLHFVGWAFLGWMLVAKVQRIRILRLRHFLFSLALLFCYCFLSIVKFLRGIEGRFEGRFFLLTRFVVFFSIIWR